MKMRCQHTAILWIFLCFAWTSQAQAQQDKTQTDKQPTSKESPKDDVQAETTKNAKPRLNANPSIRELEGILAAISGDRMKIQDENKKDYFAVVTPSSRIQYAGTTDAKFLRPGYMVRFQAEFDAQSGISVSPLGELEVFRPVSNKRLQPDERQSQTPGVYPVQKGSEKTATRVMRQDTNRAAAQSKRFLVVGQLRVIQPTKLQVLVGNRPVIVDIGNQTKISVAASDAMFCLPGDKVKLTGIPIPGQPNLIQVDTLEVEGAKPIGASTNNLQKPTTETATQRSNRRQFRKR